MQSKTTHPSSDYGLSQSIDKNIKSIRSHISISLTSTFNPFVDPYENMSFMIYDPSTGQQNETDGVNDTYRLRKYQPFNVQYALLLTQSFGGVIPASTGWATTHDNCTSTSTCFEAYLVFGDPPRICGLLGI